MPNVLWFIFMTDKWLIYYDPSVVELTSGNEVGNLIQNDIIVKGGGCLISAAANADFELADLSDRGKSI